MRGRFLVPMTAADLSLLRELQQTLKDEDVPAPMISLYGGLIDDLGELIERVKNEGERQS